MSWNTTTSKLGRSLLAAVCTVGVLAASAHAKIEGVSYTLIPTYNSIRWNDSVGLSDAELFGGQLGVNFGQYLSLNGFYMGRNGERTDLAGQGLLDALSQPLVDQDVDLKNYGADLILNLGRGDVVPFVKAGGGIYRFDTADGDRTNQINLRFGGGLRFGVDRFRVMTYVEDSAMRLDRYDLAANGPSDPAFPVDADKNTLRHNLSFGAGVEFKLGGQSSDGPTALDEEILRRYRAGFSGLSLPVEVFAGKLGFEDRLGLKDQDLVGVRTGLDFGRMVGLRGYYWQGVESGFDATDPISSYGGEVQLNLNQGQGGVPYLVLGAGQLDFGRSYTDESGLGRDDKTLLIAGGGVAFTVGQRVKLDLSVRDYMFADESLSSLAGTEDLSHNWLFSGGLNFAFGGGSSSRATSARVEPVSAPVAAVSVDTTTIATAEPTELAAVSRAEPTAEQRWAELEARIASEFASRDQAMADSLRAREARAQAAKPVPMAVTPKVTEAPAATVQDFHGERTVTIPVPAQGELYVRYGTPGGVEIRSELQAHEEVRPRPVVVAPVATVDSVRTQVVETPAAVDAESIRAIIRQELEQSREQAPVAEPTKDSTAAADTAAKDVSAAEAKESDAEAMADMEARLADALAKQVDARFDELERRMTPPAPSTPNTIVIQDETPSTPVTVTSSRRGWHARGAYTYLGVGVDDPSQAVVGGRLDLGPVTTGSKMHFLPELALGYGSGSTSFMAAGNLQWIMRDLTEDGTWSPMVGVGAGILGFSKSVDGRSKQEGVLNLSYGIAAHLGDWKGFVEHQGVDLFDLNRILVGVQWSFGN